MRSSRCDSSKRSKFIKWVSCNLIIFNLIWLTACDDFAGSAGGGQGQGGGGGGSGTGGGGGSVVSEETALVVSRPVTILDRSGSSIGTGSLTLDHPKNVQQNLSATIRLEITPPALSDTTESVPVQATQTSETITVIVGDVNLREFMGAEIRGVDRDLFNIAATPSDGMRLVQDTEVTWWEWSIRPKGSESVGHRQLSVALFLPRSLEGGSELNQEVAVIPVEIEVLPDPSAGTAPGEPAIAGAANAAQDLITIATAITAMAGVVGLAWRGWKALQGQRQKPSAEVQEDKKPERTRRAKK